MSFDPTALDDDQKKQIIQAYLTQAPNNELRDLLESLGDELNRRGLGGWLAIQ